MPVQFLGQEDPPEKKMAQRIGHDLATKQQQFVIEATDSTLCRIRLSIISKKIEFPVSTVNCLEPLVNFR